MAKLISLGLSDDEPPEPPVPALPPVRAGSSISGVFRALTRQPESERIDPSSEAERASVLIQEAELELLSAMCGPDDKARLLASLVEVKAAAGLRTEATLRSAHGTAGQIADDVAAADALVAIARAEDAAGVKGGTSLAAAKARLQDRASAGAARVRARIALLEFRRGGESSATFKASKQILEPATPAELAMALGAVAVCEAQAERDPDPTFQRALFCLQQEDDPARERQTRSTLAAQLAEAGRAARADEMLARLSAQDDETLAAAAAALGGIAAALVWHGEVDAALGRLERLPENAPVAARVAALARAVAALALADRFEEARKLMARAVRLLEQGSAALSLLGPLDDAATEAYAIAQASLGQLVEARATAARAGRLEPRARLEVALASARVGAKLLRDARRRSAR